ncbi:hypothetical protein G3545_13175 [Starkeya sp. ORNL1]|uniref:hypothetical protein n=1 Tax=Starkeya sp. ORNL1 TaxID=2709380 RepID=UPI00146496F4|nr:hypothetical protein [Starkeya sp. ORNL1]QJP14510.1 hypothetical protein G3545_13175 [Starkeya sp. ORNL1]
MAINLRSDLAKLTDDELAERYHQLWTAYEAARARPQSPSNINGWRGPIRHPRFYRFLTIVNKGFSPEFWFDLLAGIIFSAKRYEPDLRASPDADADLSLKDVQDVMDEMQRRVDRRKG